MIRNIRSVAAVLLMFGAVVVVLFPVLRGFPLRVRVLLGLQETEQLTELLSQLRLLLVGLIPMLPFVRRLRQVDLFDHRAALVRLPFKPSEGGFVGRSQVVVKVENSGVVRPLRQKRLLRAFVQARLTRDRVVPSAATSRVFLLVDVLEKRLFWSVFSLALRWMLFV